MRVIDLHFFIKFLFSLVVKSNGCIWAVIIGNLLNFEFTFDCLITCLELKNLKKTS